MVQFSRLFLCLVLVVPSLATASEETNEGSRNRDELELIPTTTRYEWKQQVVPQQRHLASIGDMLSGHEDLALIAQIMAMDDKTAASLLTTSNDDSQLGSMVTAILPLSFAFDALPVRLRSNLLLANNNDDATGAAGSWQAHRCDLAQYHWSQTHLAVPDNRYNSAEDYKSASSSSSSSSSSSTTTTSTLTMVNQKIVFVSMPNRYNVAFHNISVISMDEFDNGSIFTIPQLLPLPWYFHTVFAMSGGSRRNPRFEQLVITAGLEDLFRNENATLTVFVPSEEALNTIVSWATPEHLQRILKYHIVADVMVTLNELPLGRTVVQNLLNYSLTIDTIPNTNRNTDGDSSSSSSSSSMTTNTITIQGQELFLSNQHLALNGVVHHINEFMRSDFVPPDTTSA